VAFTPDGRKLAVTCLSHVMVFEAPEPAQGKTDELALWVEAITGRTLDEQEGVAPVGLNEWESRYRELTKKNATPRSVARSPEWELSNHLGSALAAHRSGDTFAAIWHLDRVITAQPDHPIAWTLKALLLEDAGRKDEARTALDRAIDQLEDDDQIAQLAWRLGNLEAEVGHWSQASTAFNTSIARGRINSDTYYPLVLSLVAAGDLGGVRRANADMLARFGAATDPQLCNSVAWPCVLAADAVDDLETPVRLANLAVKGAPDDEQPMYMNTLGAALYRAARFDDAIGQLTEGIKRRHGASEPQDWVFLALAHHHLGHRDQALHWLEKLRKHHSMHGPNSFWPDLEIRLFTSEAEAVILLDPISPATHLPTDLTSARVAKKNSDGMKTIALQSHLLGYERHRH
jgi:Flp pilus assembly protein TadD